MHGTCIKIKIKKKVIVEQKWLNVLRTETPLLRNCTYTAKGTFVPSSTLAIISLTPRFKQAARANSCHNIAIGLYSAVV
jgi:hypothetical protein